MRIRIAVMKKTKYLGTPEKDERHAGSDLAGKRMHAGPARQKASVV